jgi:hypothetical protein
MKRNIKNFGIQGRRHIFMSKQVITDITYELSKEQKAEEWDKLASHAVNPLSAGTDAQLNTQIKQKQSLSR